MLRHLGSLALVVPLVLAVLPARADEGPNDHNKAPTHTIVIDGERIAPSTTTMDKGDSLVFQNQAFQPIQVSFIAPKDLQQKVRCSLTGMPAEKRPPWGLFQFEGDRLVGMIPPGRFGSICSLAPGNYSFTVRQITAGVEDGGDSMLANEGQIVVK